MYFTAAALIAVTDEELFMTISKKIKKIRKCKYKLLTASVMQMFVVMFALKYLIITECCYQCLLG